MALSHQKFREIVLQILYSQDLGHAEQKVMLELMMTELAVSKKNVRLAQEKVQRIVDHLSQIDPMIATVSTSYAFERIQTVTKNILRLGVYELFFEKEIPPNIPTPPRVIISEAIRLSRKFSSPESASFVNALLDHLYQASIGEKIAPQNFEAQVQSLLENEAEASKIIEENKIQLDEHEDEIE